MSCLEKPRTWREGGAVLHFRVKLEVFEEFFARNHRFRFRNFEPDFRERNELDSRKQYFLFGFIVFKALIENRAYLLDTRRKLNMHKTLRTRLTGRKLKVNTEAVGQRCS